MGWKLSSEWDKMIREGRRRREKRRLETQGEGREGGMEGGKE